MKKIVNKKLKNIEFKLKKLLNGGLFGMYKSNFSGNGMEFDEHKEYSFSDPIKNIDWKASAKTDIIYVKKYEEDRDLNILFALDNSSSMNFGSKESTKKEVLEEIFYALALSAYNNNDNIGAIIFDEEKLDFIEYKKSKANIYKILEKIEGHTLTEKNIDVSSSVSIKKILQEIINRKIKNNLIFILTDKTDNIDEKLLRLIGEKNEIVFINIFDVFEKELIDLEGDISFSSGKKFLSLKLDKQKVSEYKKNIEKKLKILKEFFNKNRISYLNIDTDDDVFSELLRYFSQIKK